MEDEQYEESSLMKKNKEISISGGDLTTNGIELHKFESILKWVLCTCIDQSSVWRSCLSWSVFFLLVILVPILSHLYYECSSCDSNHQRPYDAIVQLSLSVFAALSFISLSSWTRKYGRRRFLFLDKLCDVSDTVRQGYTAQIHRSMKLLSCFVVPCFVADCVYKLWWYITGANEIPYYKNMYISDIITCTFQLCSWLYRTTIFLLVCVLFRLICYLQILRMEDFAQVFQKENDVVSILKEHLRIRRNLRIISHRFRAFVLLTVLLVTASQLASLLSTTRSGANVNIFTAGELALCSISLVTGLFICLRSATKITHKAQSVASLAAKWHICATINCFDNMEGDDSPPPTQIAPLQHICATINCFDNMEGDDSPPPTQIAPSQVFSVGPNWESDDDDFDEADEEDNLDNTKLVPVYANTISFQRRQALVKYFEKNRAGITVFGIVVDRTWLHTIFAIQLSLLLWLLNKTVGLS